MQFYRIGLLAALLLYALPYSLGNLHGRSSAPYVAGAPAEDGCERPMYTVMPGTFFAEATENEVMLGHDFVVTQYESDYYITYSYSNLFSNYCDQSNNVYIEGRAGAFRTGSLQWNHISPDAATSGSKTVGLGPNRSQQSYITVYYTGRNLVALGPVTTGCSREVDLNGPITGITSYIFPPSGVSADDGVEDDRITITWEKGTDVPETLHAYRIYRNDQLIHTTSNGSARSYVDTGLQPGQSYTYKVTTYSAYYNMESSSGTDVGSTFSIGLAATDGTKYNVTNLGWNDLSDIAEEIRIERSNPDGSGREELAVLSGNARGYNDDSGIPGYAYLYYVTPIGGTYYTDTDSGFSRANGTVKGHVRSSLGAGVSGVDVTLTLQDAIPAGGGALPAGCGATYCTTTDGEGYYEFQNVYYYEEAEFIVTPSKTGTIPHEFSPATAKRSLTMSANNVLGVDFTDLTVFTVGGQVAYPESPNGVTCGVEGVRILIDSTDYGIQTDKNGEWSFALQDEGTYVFTPLFLHHRLEDASGNTRTTAFVNEDKVDLDFTDVETDTLRVVVQGSCSTPLGDSAIVRIAASGNCYFADYATDENGILELTQLPARSYQVEVVNLYGSSSNLTNILDQIGNKAIDIDLTVRDTSEVITETDTTSYIPEIRDTLANDSIIILQAADTILAGTQDTVRAAVNPVVTFTYRAPLDISIDYVAAGATQTLCTNSEGDDIVVMEQGFSYNLDINVKEILGADCYIDTGFLKIYDFVSDRGSQFVRVPIQGGIASYRVDAGEPIIAESTVHNHEKLLYIIPEVDLVEPVPVESWILVTGAKSNTPSFITRTPDIPMLILHDPPGDNSFSYVEKGTSYTNFTTNETQVGGGAGVFANLLLGAKILTPFSGNGFGTIIKFSAEAGRDNFDRNGTYTTMTFTENFSTSDLDNLTGEAGDVYIGAAYNQEFALADFLTYDEATCSANVDVVPSLSGQDFATTFVYTENHIKNTLLPTLGLLKENIIDDQAFADLSVEDQAEVNNLIRDSLMWENILAKNDTARGKDATFVENVSFSAGAPITREYENDTVTSVSYEYNTFVNTEFALGAKIDNESGIWFDSELGVMGKFRWSTTTNAGNDTTKTRKVGYVLDDGDIGDFFSVDILTDKAYNVPAFNLKLGTTSCPQEPGSQARDRPTIAILPPEVTNVPTDGTANFLCQVANLSESRETREYAVRVISTTNPDGAQIRLGGQLINNGGANFFIPYGQTANLNLSVTRGPLASNYSDIGIMVYPPCEYELWQDGGTLLNADTAYIKILNFETECTNITLRNPDDGWLINQNTGDQLRTTLSGYDLNNEDFSYVTVEVKKEGEGYRPFARLTKEELVGANYDLTLDMSTFDDGAYRVRATANCGLSGITYSSEKRGIIDRNSLAPYGIPRPSDGFLRLGQEISVSFDKDIDCNFTAGYQPVVRLVREDTGEEIDVTTSCFGNELIINTSPHLTERPELQGVRVVATVDSLQDLSGNMQKYATNWSFLVNVNPVFWDPDPIYYAGLEGKAHVVKTTLKNNTLVSKEFSLVAADAPDVIRYPDWLTPRRTRGTILPSDDYLIEWDVRGDLSPGIYTDTITALVDGRAISAPITFELLAETVNWPFDPTPYEYDMTVVAQFSLDGTDTQLSTDTRDLIGAFVNGEIRGVAPLEFIEETNSYAAFLQVHSDDPGGSNGEEITFRFWHALNGVEYGAIESLTFRSDDHVGTASEPFILHPEGIFQVIPLNQGWNWISLNVAGADMSREHLLQSLLGSTANNDIVIKNQSTSAQYSPGTGWNGNLRNLKLGAGYLLYLSNAPDTLKVVGLPSPTPITTTVATNWNWIGYPRLAPAPVNEVLAGITGTNGDILKEKSRFAVFEDATGSWTGNLRQFRPGQGYKLQVATTGTIVHPPQKDKGYSVERGLYEHNLTLTGTFDAGLLGQSYADLNVVAFIDGEARGVATMEYCEAEGEYRAYLIVSGNAADFTAPIEFRIVQTVDGTEYATSGEPRFFVPDEIVGSVSDPYLFLPLSTPVRSVTGEAYWLGGNQPNPAADQTIIPFAVPASSRVTLELLDLNGRVLSVLADQTFSAGEHRWPVQLTHLAGGVYMYRMRTEHFEESRRMIVR